MFYPVKRWTITVIIGGREKTSEKAPVKPAFPTLPVLRMVPLLAGFPPTVVGFKNIFPTKLPPLETRGPSKAHVSIVAEMCKGCDLCVLACPSGNLAASDQLNRNGYHPVVFSYEGTRGPCSACGICYWVCPDFAISEIRRLRQ